MSLIIPDELIEALATVRNDATPEDFVVAGFDADDSLKVIDCGSDGIAGIKAVLPDNDVAYALLRKKFSWEQLGQVRTETIKFIYIMWRPEVIPLRRKMKIGSYDGQIKRLFSSYHTDMEINEEDELSEEIVDEILKKITQTADRVTQRKSATFIRGGNKIGWHKTSDMLKPDTQADFKLVKGANIKWAEGSDEELAAAIAEVRDDKSPIRWCLATYESKEPGSDPVLYEYLLNGPFEERSKFDEWVTQMVGSTDPQFYAIIENESSLVMGLISLLCIDKNNGGIEIGHVVFGANMQRKPFGTEAIYLLGKLAMDDLGYRRLAWRCHNENQRSRRAAQRFGFTFEGVFRQHYVCKDRNRNTAWFSIIDSEWPVCRNAFEKWLAPENFDAEGLQVQTLDAIRASLKSL